MFQSAREYFSSNLGRSYDARLSRLRGTYLFNIRGVGTWRLSIEDGHLNLEENNRPAECILNWDEPDFLDVINDRRSFIVAFLQGRVELQGKKERAAGLVPYFKGGGRKAA